MVPLIPKKDKTEIFTHKGIVDDVISHGLKDFFLRGYGVVDLIKGKSLIIIADFYRDLALIVIDVVAITSHFELIVIERPDSNEHFKTAIGIGIVVPEGWHWIDCVYILCFNFFQFRLEEQTYFSLLNKKLYLFRLDFIYLAIHSFNCFFIKSTNWWIDLFFVLILSNF